MRPVNLIPSDQRRGDSAPLRAGVASYAIVGVLALALVAAVAMVLTGNDIKKQRGELSSLQARKAQAEQSASALAPYADFASLAASRTETVESLAKSRFDWERVLHELALVMPQDVWLDSLTGSVAAGASTGAATSASSSSDPSITGPSLAISGCADSQTTVARFLAALKDIDGVTRVGMQQSSLGEESTDSAAATDSASSGSSGSCQTRSFIAQFSITVAFDAVPATTFAPSTGTESTTAAATTTDATTTDDGGVAATEAEQQTAVDSAGEQTQQASDSASAVGLGQ